MGETTGIRNDGMDDKATANDEEGAPYGEEEIASADMDDEATGSDEGGSKVASGGGVDKGMGGTENDVEGSVNKGSPHDHHDYLTLEGMERVAETTTVEEAGKGFSKAIPAHRHYEWMKWTAAEGVCEMTGPAMCLGLGFYQKSLRHPWVLHTSRGYRLCQ